MENLHRSDPRRRSLAGDGVIPLPPTRWKYYRAPSKARYHPILGDDDKMVSYIISVWAFPVAIFELSTAAVAQNMKITRGTPQTTFGRSTKSALYSTFQSHLVIHYPSHV